jgi:hypothetical protein
MTACMRLLFVVGLAVLFTGCPQPQPNGGCNPDNCAGCCEPSGKCQLGQSTTRCGSNGNTCGQCGMGLSCVSGLCSANGAGGSSGTGGGSATGGGVGGSGGGSSGTTGQELVSGTRLRAVNFTGSDGARAPFVFFDLTLQTYCQAGFSFPGATGARCYPLALGVQVPSESKLFLDAQCATPAYGLTGTDVGLLAMDGGLAAGITLVLNVDGGFNVGTPVGSAFELVTPQDGGCGPAPGGRKYFSAGMPVPPGAFAPMPLVRE